MLSLHPRFEIDEDRSVIVEKEGPTTSQLLDSGDEAGVEPAERTEPDLNVYADALLLVNRLGVKWFETRSVSSSRKSKISVRPRGFPWFSRTLPRDHRSDSLEQSGGSRSGRPRPPMPAVAPSEPVEGC